MRAQQLRPLDAAYLALDGPRTVGNVCLLLPLDRPVTFADLRGQISTRVGRLPEFRRRLQALPFGIDRPWLVDDVDFDLDHHVLESYAGHGALPAAVAGIAMTPLDRRRPLWEVHLLHEERGETVIVTKVHHAIADGSRMRDILHALLGTDQLVDDDPGWEPESAPPVSAMLARSAVDWATWSMGTAARIARQAVTEPSTLTGAVDFSGWPGAPATIVNKPVSGRRAMAYGTWNLAASKPIRTKLGATVNDLLHACAAAGLRHWLSERDALPSSPLVAMVPISVRHLAVDQSGANRIALTLCTIPTDVEDRAERVAAARAAMAVAKSHVAANEDALTMVARAFASMLSPGSNLASVLRLPDVIHLPFNTVISNVPMGQDLFGVGEARVTSVYPMPPLGEGMGFNVTAQGYQGKLDVGVSVCPELIPDVEVLYEIMADEWRALCDLA
ncbi:MAG: DUF1298 domain-containing protein [Dermatophilaceae bacterium]|jgi:diacylglycerol O-acyltransferase|nr:DUF1298 domain-containing protein [Actinomycetales bacterium]MBP8880274.1 DUF1298 domain-containing protein [Dermatophilaceae bacterium]MBP9917819.1 DUF1298 domain-containing protein [Dermatophilaceae bacterium]